MEVLIKILSGCVWDGEFWIIRMTSNFSSLTLIFNT